MRRVITYGTFDLLHYGHIRLLQRARSRGDYLIVALSTDEFNAGKEKVAYFSFAERKQMLEAVRHVDLVIPERTWTQKADDIRRYDIATLVMGDDWTGKFDELSSVCQVEYLDRTPEISTTLIKQDLTHMANR